MLLCWSDDDLTMYLVMYINVTLSHEESVNCCDGHYCSYKNADGDCASSAAHGLLGSRVQLVMLLYGQSSVLFLRIFMDVVSL